MSVFLSRICYVIIAFFLCFALSGCVGSINPPDSVLIDALEIQVQLTENSLEDLLDLEEGSLDILSVNVDSTNFVESQGSRIISVAGDVDCRFTGSIETTNTPFQLFLERGEKQQSWRLAKPLITSNGLSREWLTYPLSIKG